MIQCFEGDGVPHHFAAYIALEAEKSEILESPYKGVAGAFDVRLWGKHAGLNPSRDMMFRAQTRILGPNLSQLVNIHLRVFNSVQELEGQLYAMHSGVADNVPFIQFTLVPLRDYGGDDDG